MSIPQWVSQYIGIPHVDMGRDNNGCDCWGLVRLVMKENKHINLPSFSTDYQSADSFSQISPIFNNQEQSGKWQHIQLGEEKPFDLAQMDTAIYSDKRWYHAPLHVGIVVANGWLLHTERKTASCLMRYRENRRVVAFWRHQCLI